MIWKNILTGLHYGSGLAIGAFSLRYFVTRKESPAKPHPFIPYKK